MINAACSAEARISSVDASSTVSPKGISIAYLLPKIIGPQYIVIAPFYKWRQSCCMPIRKSPGRPGKDEPSAPSRRRGIRIPLEIDKLLEQVAAAKGLSVHAAIREAIQAWVDQNRETDR